MDNTIIWKSKRMDWKSKKKKKNEQKHRNCLIINRLESSYLRNEVFSSIYLMSCLKILVNFRIEKEIIRID